MQFNLLDRVVAGVGIERVDCIHAVEAVATAIAAFENLHVHPWMLLDGAAESNRAQIAYPRVAGPGNGEQRALYDGVGERISRTRPAIVGAGKIGLASVPFGATMVINR